MAHVMCYEIRVGVSVGTGGGPVALGVGMPRVADEQIRNALSALAVAADEWNELSLAELPPDEAEALVYKAREYAN